MVDWDAFRAQAREVLELTDEAVQATLTDDNAPAIRAFTDQWFAAQADFGTKMSDHMELPLRTAPASEDSVAWTLAVFQAARRRVNRCCDHYPWDDPGFVPNPAEQYIVLMGTGLAACRRCFVAGGVQDVADDNRCDVCDAPTEQFTPFVAQYGPISVQGDVCNSCRDFGLAQAPATPGAGNGSR